MSEPLKNNPLFKLSNKRVLSQLIHLPLEQILLVSKNQPDFYNFFDKKTKNKIRPIQEPKEPLKSAHKILNGLLKKIETPVYLFSKKGYSYINNAKYHLGNKYFLKVDISDFFPSCTKEFVFRFFKRKLRMSDDLAWLITKVSTIGNKLPTGSPISQSLAYWAYKDVFDKICNFSLTQGLKFSLYVDDMVFSSNYKIQNTLVPFIKKCLGESGLKLKRKKIRAYGDSDYKLITGCIISPSGELLAPYQLTEKIFTQLSEQPDINEYSEKAISSLIGRIQVAGQIKEGLYFSLLGKLKIQKNKIAELEHLYKYGM